MTPTIVVDEKLARIASAYAEAAEPLPEGRSGIVTRACLDATRHLIITGKKKPLDTSDPRC